jgi:hypothetical protein
VCASPDPAPSGAGGTVPGLPSRAAAILVEAGLDVLGALASADYDASVPPGWQTRRVAGGAAAGRVRSALVVGSGGTRLAARAIDAGGPDPVDRETDRAVRACMAALEDGGERCWAVHAGERRDARGRVCADAGDFADFVALGEASGLGARSRLRLLLHPEYGPWLAVRSVVLTTAALGPTGPLRGFDPCAGCPAPCRGACPAGALDAGPLEVGRCARERLAGGACGLRCAARHACVSGRAHAHSERIEGHFMRTSLRILASPR